MKKFSDNKRGVNKKEKKIYLENPDKLWKSCSESATDVLGSYTGLPAENETPEQDADDL